MRSSGGAVGMFYLGHFIWARFIPARRLPALCQLAAQSQQPRSRSSQKPALLPGRQPRPRSPSQKLQAARQSLHGGCGARERGGKGRCGRDTAPRLQSWTRAGCMSGGMPACRLAAPITANVETTCPSPYVAAFTAVRHPGQGQTSGETRQESHRGSPGSNASAQEEQRVTEGLVACSFLLKELENLGASK